MVLSYEQMHELCNHIYIGMSFKEALILIGVTQEQLPAISRDHNLKRLVEYARTKAKKDIFEQAHKVAQGEKSSIVHVQVLKHLLSSRFGYSENRYELKQKDRQHLQLLRHKEHALKQWADYQSAKMVADASIDQLEEYQK